MAQRKNTFGIRLTVAILIVVVVAILGMVIIRQAVFVPEAAQSGPPPDLSAMHAFVYDEARPLADFQLVNEQGESVTSAALTGHWTFAYVGYTSCPDVCPTTLAMLRQARQELAGSGPMPQYLLISADPERDTPSRLNTYLNAFGEGFHGLTGDIDTLRALARSLNADFSRRTDENGRIVVDHSAHLALINPQGEMAAVLQPPFQPEQVVSAYRQVVQWYGPDGA
ncbi:SCO family protein [Marinobacter halodurans]|uniref:SCO family protein n=1 Tax=Marinobacter halodurans TaxID=2528979 RepID=A0ABY1ZN86_9GAMM|nr:SCO family protein [Marinobacter halodurans]TBW56496.1 SCO family protein [Marinobacter halodurans]